jgi:hypothetical protein
MDQTWYADDAGAGGKFDAIKRHFEKLEEIGPNYGYFPEPSKILIVSQENPAALEALSHVTITSSRYLGGFIGEREALDIWIQEKSLNGGCGRGASHRRRRLPASAYTVAEVSAAGMAVLQRVVKDIGDAFTVVGKAIPNLSFRPLW